MLMYAIRSSRSIWSNYKQHLKVKSNVSIKSKFRSVWTVEFDSGTIEKTGVKPYGPYDMKWYKISFEGTVYFSINFEWFDWWRSNFIIYGIMVYHFIFMIFKAQFNPSNLDYSQIGICVFTEECTDVIKTFTRKQWMQPQYLVQSGRNFTVCILSW